VSVHVCSLSRSHFFVDFYQIGHRGVNPQKQERVHWGQYRPTRSPILPLKIAIFDPEVLKIHANTKHAISALNVHVSPKFLRLIKIGAGKHDGDVRFLMESTPCPGKKEASSFSTISRAVLDRFS